MTPTRPVPGQHAPATPGPASPRPGRNARAVPATTGLPAAMRLAVVLVALSGCTFGGPRQTPGQRQAVAACKTDADRAYLQQNRVLLSQRSQRDTPFSSSGTVGVTSEGLPQLYRRSGDFEACLRSHEVDGAIPAVSGAASPGMDPSYQP